MKRWLLPASAAVLVLIACGAGVKPAPRVTEAEARVASLHTIVARRQATALAQARRLVDDFAAPPGARRDRAKRDHGGILHRSGRRPFGETVGAVRFWRLREPLATAVAFVKAHDPHGFVVFDSGYGNQRARGRVPAARYLMRTLASPSARVEGASRYLNETIAALPGRTVIRVEADVTWIYPRSPTERVPTGTTEVAVRAPKVSVDVKNPAKVARIIRWFDALPVYPPGIAAACPAVGYVDITVSFRTADGTRVAHASVPPASANICDPIRFTIGGQQRRALIDRAYGPSFARRLQQLLGVHLLHTHR
jgi:hypothetical protein